MSFQQLELPLAGLAPHAEPVRIPRSRRIFANRNLKMAHIDWVGFDMDYTLAIYNQAEMDHLSIQATLSKLIERGYPQLLSDVEYRIDFAIRGLLIDKRTGNILKLDRFKVAQKGFHGLTELSPDDLRTAYHNKRIRTGTPRYHWIDTLYALSEATLYAGIVDALEKRDIHVDYGQLFTDIRTCIDLAHRDGSIVTEVQNNLPRFVDRDPLLAPTLHKLRSAGKRLFLLTNSHWPFTEKMMTYLLDGAMPEYPTYRHYFDAIVCAAQKPVFFQERRPLLQQLGGELQPAGTTYERGAVYIGGNLIDLERMLGAPGDRILYVGDHIYGDILRSKKESAWRTAMIIQEMEVEVRAHESCLAEHERSADLALRRDELEDQLRFFQQQFKELNRRIEEAERKMNGTSPNNGNGRASKNGASKRAPSAPGPLGARSDHRAALEAERARVKRAVERIRGLLRNLNNETRALDRDIDRRFHPFWGSLMKEAHEKSSFGDQVEEYACVYTSRVSNLLGYSPLQFYRSARDLMPHEL